MTERRVFDASDPDVDAYRLMTGLVVPRPIAWISTLSADGVGNLAPFSFFTIASGQPPVVAFTAVGPKDTLDNVRATGEFTVSLTTRAQLDLANASSAAYEAHVDEADALGIAMEPSERVAPPRVAGSPASLECVLHSAVEVGDSTVVFGEVVTMTVREDALDGEHPVIDRLEPVSRLGDDEWGLPPQAVRVTRPEQG